jgi:hypothetical protein
MIQCNCSSLGCPPHPGGEQFFDEFALFLPGVDQPTATRTMQKMEEKVADEMIAIRSPITLSAGVITFHSPPGFCE